MHLRKEFVLNQRIYFFLDKIVYHMKEIFNYNLIQFKHKARKGEWEKSILVEYTTRYRSLIFQRRYFACLSMPLGFLRICKSDSMSRRRYSTESQASFPASASNLRRFLKNKKGVRWTPTWRMNCKKSAPLDIVQKWELDRALRNTVLNRPKAFPVTT